MRRYAEKTDVPVDRSRAEIEHVLTRYGADQFMYGTKQGTAVVAFRARGRHVRFVLPLPSPAELEVTDTGRSRRRDADRETLYQQSVRQRWRALALAIKAKLEAVQAGITQFEEEFMSHIILPDGTTVGERMLPQIEHAYQTGKMPPLLTHLGE